MLIPVFDFKGFFFFLHFLIQMIKRQSALQYGDSLLHKLV